MVKHSAIYFGAIILLYLFSCSATKNNVRSNSSSSNIIDNGNQQVPAKNANQPNHSIRPNEDRPSNISLADMLRRIPGVLVNGRGDNITVKVGGATSIHSSTDPLYVVDGISVASYAQVVAIVYPNDVKSINVLKGADASIYGVRGANGVIVITTK